MFNTFFRTEYLFVFNDKFEIEEDFDVLKHIGLTMGIYLCFVFLLL